MTTVTLRPDTVEYLERFRELHKNRFGFINTDLPSIVHESVKVAVGYYMALRLGIVTPEREQSAAALQKLVEEAQAWGLYEAPPGDTRHDPEPTENNPA